MRRKDREVSEHEEIREILDQCKTCHLAMIDGEEPYVIPLSFGYQLEDGRLTLYFHSAKEGRKIDILRRNSRVCFELCCEGQPVFAKETPCASGYCYSSVHGAGQAVFVTEPGEKCAALSAIVRQQAGFDAAFVPAQAEGVCVYKVTAESFTGKRKQKP